MRAAWRWLIGALTDPVTGDASSSRIGAMALCVVGCMIAVKHPTEAATVAALIAGGAVAIWTRTKSD